MTRKERRTRRFRRIAERLDRVRQGLSRAEVHETKEGVSLFLALETTANRLRDVADEMEAPRQP